MKSCLPLLVNSVPGTQKGLYHPESWEGTKGRSRPTFGFVLERIHLRIQIRKEFFSGNRLGKRTIFVFFTFPVYYICKILTFLMGNDQRKCKSSYHSMKSLPQKKKKLKHNSPTMYLIKHKVGLWNKLTHNVWLSSNLDGGFTAITLTKP